MTKPYNNEHSVSDAPDSNSHFFESMDRVNRAIQGTRDLDEMMVIVLDTVLALFDCDRAFLVYPCDPKAESLQVSMQRTHPEYPGGYSARTLYPMTPDMADSLQILLDSEAPATFGEGNRYPIGEAFSETHLIKSNMSMAIYPKGDEPWQFGVHQCSTERVWSTAEIRLFEAIGRRLADRLSLMLAFKSLQQQEEKYSRFVNLAGEGVWSLDAQGRTDFVNARLTEILGYPADEILGRPVTDFMYEEDIPDFLEKLRNGFKKAKGPYERRYRRYNGEEIWVTVSATGIYDDEGNVINSFGMVADITARKQAEEALKRLNEELEAKVMERTSELIASHRELEKAYRDLKLAHARILQQEKMVSIGQLASGIAHEINTPSQYVSNNIGFIRDSTEKLLNSVGKCRDVLSQIDDGKFDDDSIRQLHARLQEMDYDYLNEELPRALRESNEGIGRITSIVVAMKDFAKPSNNVLKPVDLGKLIKDTVEISRNSWKSVAELTVEPATEPLIVSGLRDELGQALLHLIINAADAIKAAHHGASDPGRIRISTSESDEWAEVMVEDTGCGMSPEVKQRAFEPFFTTKDVGSGTGQSLAIAYHIVTDKHGGRLTVESSPGEGSIFTIHLPIESERGDKIDADER